MTLFYPSLLTLFSVLEFDAGVRDQGNFQECRDRRYRQSRYFVRRARRRVRVGRFFALANRLGYSTTLACTLTQSAVRRIPGRLDPTEAHV